MALKDLSPDEQAKKMGLIKSGRKLVSDQGQIVYKDPLSGELYVAIKGELKRLNETKNFRELIENYLKSPLFKEAKMKKIQEDVKGVKSSGIPAIDTTKDDDGQLRRNFYVPSVMVERDVIANILDKFSKHGVTHSFQGSDLIINAGTYSTFAQDKVAQELEINIIEIIKFLKDEYKATTGKVLVIGKIKNKEFDCVANYTTNHLSLCRLTCVYRLPNSKATNDAGSEKGEIRGNIPVFRPKTK